MNLPQYRRAIESAANEYLVACEDARERMLKALAVAHEEFFEEDRKAVTLEDKAVNFEDTERRRR